MSCLSISMNTLASVRETLRSSYWWNEDRHETPASLWHALTGGHPVRSDIVATRYAEEFAERAFVFNSIEYSKGEEARTNAEPKDWGVAINIARHGQAKRIPIIQLIKSLQCIDYNTSPEGWLEKDEYENWARREEFESFKKQLDRIIHCLLSHVVSGMPEYEKAVWG